METKIFEFVPEESEHFESQFLKWYDAGKPKNNFNEAYNYSTITQFLIWEYGLSDESYDKPRRWNQIVEGVVYINGRYFSVCYDRGLTEMQENDYSIYTSILEVYKKRVVTEEYLTEEEIECGSYEFV